MKIILLILTLIGYAIRGGKVSEKEEMSFFAEVFYPGDYEVKKLKQYECKYVMIPHEIDKLFNISSGDILEVTIKKAKKIK
jgi:hypothetical protein